MPATAVSTQSTGNAFLEKIDTNTKWQGTIIVNLIDPNDPAELALFTNNLNLNEYGTNNVGIVGDIWDTVVDSFNIYKQYANFEWSPEDNATDANYFASDFYDKIFVSQPASGIAGPPGAGSIIAFDPSHWSGFSSQLQQWVVLHEIGHALGLAHPTNLGLLDYTQYTVMSGNYYQLDGNQGDTTGRSVTPMALDVALLQSKYGAANTNSGNTTYRLTNAGLDLDGSDAIVQNADAYVCIWDSGGDEDTIEYNGLSRVLINLNTATLDANISGELQSVISALTNTNAWSSLNSQTKLEITDANRHAGGFFSSILNGSDRSPGGYTIAKNAQIERAFGGGDDDILVGNALANVIWGRGGQDAAVDGAGEDYIFGAAGNDHVVLVVDDARDVVIGGEGADTLTGNNSDGDDGDVLFGGELDQLETATDEDPALQAALEAFQGLADQASERAPTSYAPGGGDGADSVSGGKGNDSISGGEGDDELLGQDGNDLVVGDAGADSLSGEAGDDILFGGSDNDTLEGGEGKDTLAGGAGVDLIRAEAEDRVLGDDDPDKVVMAAGSSTLAGGAGNDLLDLSGAPASGFPCTIELNDGDGHDWIEFSGERVALTIDAPDATSAQIEIVVDNSERVLTQYYGSPDPGDEQPEERVYEVDAYLKIGSDTIYIGKAYYYEYEDFNGQIESEELGELFNDVTVVTSDGETNLADWISENGRDVAPNGFLDPYDDGIDDYDEGSGGGGSSGNDAVGGGSGADDLGGGRGADSLSAGDGDDALRGGTGDDVLFGGAGADRLDGSKGSDVAQFDGSQGDYAFSRQADGALIVQHLATNAIDTLYSVETLRFASGGDVSASTLAPLDGTRGRDEIAISGSGKTAHGFRGDDVLTLTGSNHTVDGGDGYDQVVLSGNQEDYEFTRLADGSFTAIETATGNSNLFVGVEALGFGSAENEVSVRSILGDHGTPEDDYIAGTSNDDNLYALDGNDYITAGAGMDSLYGGNGNDFLAGGDGIDFLSAGSGADTLDGGAGDDLLFGSRGNDVFLIQQAPGSDVIADFSPGDDQIQFFGVGFVDFADMLSHSTQSGEHVRIDLPNGDILQLNRIEIASFQAADFIFS